MNSSSEIQPTPDAGGSGPRPQSDFKMIFVGRQGIRAGWRLGIYLSLVIGIGFAMFAALLQIRGFANAFAAVQHGEMNPLGLFCSEAPLALTVLVAAWIMSLIEQRKPGVYGIPLNQLFGSLFWRGMLWGLIAVSVVVGLIAAFKGYSFGSIALSTPEIFNKGGAYLFGFLLVGVFEEFTFRGYAQYTLASGMQVFVSNEETRRQMSESSVPFQGFGFWSAAALLSALFGATHLGNPGEGWVGALSVFCIAMFFAFTLRRTGNLWFAIGLHCSFDWGETFLYSVPNSGLTASGALSHAALHGDRWLTGGSVGPEGSVFCFITVALMFVVFHLLHPAKAQ
jgi:uncharacterized protein